MKIIYVAISVIPSYKANALQVMKTCEAIKNHGADLELIIPVRFGGVRLKDSPFEFYNIKNKFKITKIFSVDLIPLSKIINGFGFFVHNVSFAFFTALYLVFKRADVYYVRDDLSAFVLSFFKKNVFCEIHRIPDSFLNKFIFKTLLKRGKGFVVIAGELKKLITEKFRINPEKIAVAHDGVDINQFNVDLSKEEARKKAGWPIDKKIVCYTGSLQHVKGVDILIRAMNLLSDVYCYIIGEKVGNIGGFKNEEYQKANNRIKFLELQPHDLMPIFLKASDVLVIPHRDLPFSFSPLKLFEYMASKRPIVASRIKILKDIINDNNALFFNPEDAEDLAEKINTVLNDENLGQNIVSAAFFTVKKYSWDNRAANILKFIKAQHI